MNFVKKAQEILNGKIKVWEDYDKQEEELKLLLKQNDKRHKNK